MRNFFIMTFAWSLSIPVLAIDSSQKIVSQDKDVLFAHTVMVEKAASDIRVRQMQKLVDEEKWARRDASEQKKKAQK